ncbi:MAG: FAD-dependent monooxygenase [Pseudomonadales bacterium]|nr:FAD-dependent monooxygenase [Pseudomonadales bacterium]
MNTTLEFDVIVIGASIAGCHLATLLSDQGLSIALVEKRASPASFKRMCSHLLHPGAVERLRSMGLLEELLQAGGQLTRLDIAIAAGPRLQYPPRKRYSMANIERRLIDPLIRERAINSPGVSYFQGFTLSELLRNEHGDIAGVRIKNKQQQVLGLSAPLTVGADGKQSSLARLANIRNITHYNGRIALFAYYKSQDTRLENQLEHRPPAKPDASKIWVLDKGQTYIAAFPNGSKTLVSCYLTEDKTGGKGAINPKQSYEQQFLHTAEQYVKQHMSLGTRLTAPIVAKHTDTVYRPYTIQGMALIGDAYLSADPLTGIGCSWAFSSAELLAKCVAKPLKNRTANPKTLHHALRCYRYQHRVRYQLPAYLMAHGSTQGRLFTHPALTHPAALLMR